MSFPLGIGLTHNTNISAFIEVCAPADYYFIKAQIKRGASESGI